MFHSLVSVGPVFFVLSSALSIGADTVKIASIFAKSGPAEISNLCHIRDDLAATKDFEGVVGVHNFYKNGDPTKGILIMRSPEAKPKPIKQ